MFCLRKFFIFLPPIGIADVAFVTVPILVDLCAELIFLKFNLVLVELFGDF